jgi:ASPIC and UnbV/FG-GAP-like repeat
MARASCAEDCRDGAQDSSREFEKFVRHPLPEVIALAPAPVKLSALDQSSPDIIARWPLAQAEAGLGLRSPAGPTRAVRASHAAGRFALPSPARSLALVTHSVGGTFGDYDNDGDLDLFVSAGTGCRLIRNDGGSWVDVTMPPLNLAGNVEGAAWGDYDNDGDLDLYIPRFGQTNELLRNENANGNHWLHVKLAGTVSNRSAIGARVKLVAGGVSRMQEISGGNGNQSQNSLDAEFGLGATGTIDSLVVLWPSGIVWDTTGVAVDQKITIVERPSNVGVEAAVPGALELSPGVPSPLRGAVTIAYAVPEAGRGSLGVYDLQGRRVATLAEGMSQAGRYAAAWNGRSSGGDAPSGVYFVRLQIRGRRGIETRQRRVVLTR